MAFFLLLCTFFVLLGYGYRLFASRSFFIQHCMSST